MQAEDLLQIKMDNNAIRNVAVVATERRTE